MIQVIIMVRPWLYGLRRLAYHPSNPSIIQAGGNLLNVKGIALRNFTLFLFYAQIYTRHLNKSILLAYINSSDTANVRSNLCCRYGTGLYLYKNFSCFLFSDHSHIFIGIYFYLPFTYHYYKRYFNFHCN